MNAVVLIGGFGTRLEPLTVTRPKAMVPVLNIPFLEYLLVNLKRSGIDQAILSIGYLPDLIRQYFGDGQKIGIDIKYVIEQFPLGTGGGIKNAAQFLNESFLVVNGDIFTDIDIVKMYNFHKDRRAVATIALTPVDDPSRYGVIETDSGGRVGRFLEKPSPENITTNMINAGLIVMEPEILESIPANVKFSYEKELFPTLLTAGKPIYGFKSDAYWIDIGTPQKYFQLNSDLLHGRSIQYLPGDASGICVHPEAVVEAGANLKGTVIVAEASGSRPTR